MLHSTSGICGQEYILGAGAGSDRPKLESSGGESDRRASLQIVRKATVYGVKDTDGTITTACSEKLTIGRKFDTKYFTKI